MPRSVAFKNRHPGFDGEFAGEHDQVVGEISPGTREELGAITVEYDGTELSWVNQQHNPTRGALQTGEQITFQSGEKLGFFDLPEDAESCLERWLEEDLEVALDLSEEDLEVALDLSVD